MSSHPKLSFESPVKDKYCYQSLKFYPPVSKFVELFTQNKIILCRERNMAKAVKICLLSISQVKAEAYNKK